MLPKNNLRRNFMRRLRVVPDAEHAYEANLYRTAQTAPQGSDADLERLRQLMFTELKDAHKVARTMGVQALAAQVGVNPVLATKPAMKAPPRSAAAS